MDVPGKDIQQQAAATNETICFFVKSLGGASCVVKMEHQATVARVKQHIALRSGVCKDVFYLVREGKVLRDDDTLKCLGLSGTRNCTCVPVSVAVRVWADSPRFLGNGYANLVAWVADGAKLFSVWCTSAGREWGS